MAGLTPPRPLTREDDRQAFDCGRESLNQWLRRHAWDNQEASVSRTSVVCDSLTGAVAGYIALSAAQIERGALPRSAQRNRPDPLPAVLLGQLATHRAFQGRGLARSLVYFALTTAVRLAQDIGCYGVLTHPLDEGLREFYGKFGFETLPFDPRRSMIVRIIDLRRNGFG